MPIAIHINAGNDTNGNPRRGFIIVDSQGTAIDFIDEGYAGTGSLQTSAYSGATPSNFTIDVSPAFYKSALRQSYGGLPSQRSQTFQPRTTPRSRRR
jgi:hypothetical protein